MFLVWDYFFDRRSERNLLFIALFTNSSLEISPSPSPSIADLTSITQEASISSCSSIPANLKSPSTMSVISSTSIDPPPSSSKAVKTQFSLSSGVSRFFTQLAWKNSSKLRVPDLSSSKTLNRDSAIKLF